MILYSGLKRRISFENVATLFLISGLAASVFSWVTWFRYPPLVDILGDPSTDDHLVALDDFRHDVWFFVFGLIGISIVLYGVGFVWRRTRGRGGRLSRGDARVMLVAGGILSIPTLLWTAIGEFDVEVNPDLPVESFIISFGLFVAIWGAVILFRRSREEDASGC